MPPFEKMAENLPSIAISIKTETFVHEKYAGLFLNIGCAARFNWPGKLLTFISEKELSTRKGQTSLSRTSTRQTRLV